MTSDAAALSTANKMLDSSERPAGAPSLQPSALADQELQLRNSNKRGGGVPNTLPNSLALGRPVEISPPSHADADNVEDLDDTMD